MPGSYDELTPGMVCDARKYLGLEPSEVVKDPQFKANCITYYGDKLWSRAIRRAKTEAGRDPDK